MQCERCGAPITENQMFCPSCGLEIVRKVAVQTPTEATQPGMKQNYVPEQSMKQPGMKQQLETPQPAMKQQPETPQPGMKQQYAQQTPQYGAQPPQKKKGKGLLIGLIAGGIATVTAIAAVIVLLVLQPWAKTHTDTYPLAADSAMDVPDPKTLDESSAGSMASEAMQGDELMTALAPKPEFEPEPEPEITAEQFAAFKIGVICVGNEISPSDRNVIQAAKAACRELGIPDANCVIATNVSEGMECYDTAVEMADAGCRLIVADSFGHEDYMIQAATEFPDVEFCTFTATKAHTEGLPNYHNAYAAIYEGRYLAGVAAGMKLNEMIVEGSIRPRQAKIGFVGSFSYAEVVSGYTAFFLGVRSVCEEATMDVIFTGSWYDEKAEREAALKLIDNGCVLISQYSDSMGVPYACESMGVPNVSYNGSTFDDCPNTYLISCRIDWEPYFTYAIQETLKEKPMPADWTGTIETGSVELADLNLNVAGVGSQEAIDAAKERLITGELHVFDVMAFRVDGRVVISYMADVDYDPEFLPDTEVVTDLYFHESEYRSAPYFDIMIDGITLLNVVF